VAPELSVFLRVSAGPADLLGDEPIGDDELGASTSRDLSPDGLTREKDGLGGGGGFRLLSKADLFVGTGGLTAESMVADAKAGCEIE
jgi:hypothetical protein